MENTHQARWQECLALIARSVSPQQYEAWFRPIVFESLDEKTHTVLLQVPSQYFYEYLEENFVDVLGRALRQHYGPDVRLSYRVVIDKEHRITRDMETDAVPPRQPAAAPGKQPATVDPQLNPRQTFANYIEGQSNKLPRSIGLSVAEHPTSTQFNPMFVFGPSGSGKTHLINAIGVRAKQLYPQKSVLYISARLFQSQFTTATLKNAVNDFIGFYQTIDILIVDDIQEWATAPKTQNAFFHIFDHLFRNGKRIVLASDRPPVQMQTMNERLLTRFVCGITAELERPNTQLCLDILRSKVKHDGIDLPEDVLQYIAESANGSVRDLQGVVNSLLAYSVVYNAKLDMRLAERVVGRTVKTDNEPLTIDDIIDAVCQHFHVTAAAVQGRSRKRETVEARQVAMYLAQKHTKMPAARVGRLIGGRDHSTVIHSCQQVEKKLKLKDEFRQHITGIEREMKIKG